MNFVIVGESRCGKSSLANMICSNIPNHAKISVDALVMAFKKAFPNNAINFYENKRNDFHVFLEAFFDNCLYMSTNCNYVFEGNIPHETVLNLSRLENVKVICLGKTEITAKEFYNEIRKYEINLSTGGWTKRLDDKTLLSWCDGWIKNSKNHKQFCENNNFIFVDTSYNQMSVLSGLVKKIESSDF